MLTELAFAVVRCDSLVHKLTFDVVKSSSGNCWVDVWTESWEGVVWTSSVVQII